MIDKEMIKRLKKNDTVTLCLSDEVLAAFRELRDNGAKIEWASDAGWICGWTEFDGSGTYRLHHAYELPEPEKKTRMVKCKVEPDRCHGHLCFEHPGWPAPLNFSEREDIPGYQGVIWEGNNSEYARPTLCLAYKGETPWQEGANVDDIKSGERRLRKPEYVVYLVKE